MAQQQQFIQSGFFNCRQWRPDTDVKDMPLLQDTDTIKFVFITDKPIEGATPTAINADKTRYTYKLKIGKWCKWCNDKGESIDRPTNADLDGKRCQVVAICSYLQKDPSNALKPSGYWVNNIAYKVVEDNPLAGVNFDNLSFGQSLKPTTADAVDEDVKEQIQDKRVEELKEELPF